MQKFMSCGILLFRNRAEPSFLLMRHRDRYSETRGTNECPCFASAA